MTTKDISVITGASSGLGLELARALVKSPNAHVVGVSRGLHSDPGWTELVSRGEVTAITGTVSDPKTVASAFDTACQLGNLRMVINAAGIGVFGPPSSYSADDVTAVVDSNLIGTILFSNAAVGRMDKSTGGMIVNVMSTAAQVGRANETVYCAAKWGARGYTESLRLELRGSKIKVIAVYPGGMSTPFWRAKGSQNDGKNFMNPALVADAILTALKSREGTYVSDIVINRG